jgi:superfamily I DNA/RNA helicase
MSELVDSALDAEQLRAVKATSGPVILRGGPGTGKTRVLAHRIADLVENRNVRPDAILVITFTDRAADEMRDRLAALLSNSADAERMLVGTFYSVACHLLNTYQAGRVPPVVDEIESIRMIREVMFEAGAIGSAEKMHEIISCAKSRSSDKAALFDNQTVGDVFEAYQQRLVKYASMDSVDSLLHVCWLLQESPETLKKLRDRFQHVLADEFQDINPVQYEMLSALAGRNTGLFVAGDPGQAVFESHGSSPRFFDQVLADFGEAETIDLKRSYRSTPEINAGAAESAGTAPIVSDRSSGLQLRHLVVENPVREGMAIAREIRRVVGGVSESGTPITLGDIGVVFRTEGQADMIERCLEQDGIPVHVTGQTAFLDTSASRHCLNFFRFVSGPTAMGLAGVLNSGCFGKGVYLTEEIDYRFVLTDIQSAVAEVPALQKAFDTFAMAALTESARAILEMWIDRTGVEGDFDKLLGIADLSTDFEDFLYRSTGVPGQIVERRGPTLRTGEAVSLTTIHASKGREFPVVFVCGVEEGLIPMEREDANIEEERRLLYVAMTRAKDELILSSVRSRSANGVSLHPQPSRFLDDLTDTIVTHERLAATSKKKDQLTLF